MTFPTTAYLKIQGFLADDRKVAARLALLGLLSLAAYGVSAVIAVFIPGIGWDRFPPYLALPEEGFGLGSYYYIYILIAANALVIFGLYLAALKIVGAAGRSGGDTGRDAGSEAGGGREDGGRRFDNLIERAGGLTGLVFGFAVLFHLVMFATPYLLSTDVFDYIRHGRIFTFYGENPLTVPATYFPADPFFNTGGWVGTGSVYGPLHVYVTGVLARAAGDGFTANLLLFKGFFIGLNLVNLGLIWKIARRMRPGLEKKAVLFYGWNPFILVMVAANAHNDILMLTLVLGGILFYLDRRFLLGAVLIVLAGLVKFVALPILLVYAVLVIRQQETALRRAALGAGIALSGTVITVLSYLPLWEGRNTFYYLTTVGQKTNFTMPSLIRDFAAEHVQLSLSNTIVQLSLAVALGGYLVWHMAGVRNAAGLLSAAAGLALLTPLVLFWFQPWYLTLVLGLVALRPWRLMYRVTLLFSFTVMFFDSFWWHSPISMDIQKPLRVLVVFGPPVALLLLLKARELIPGAIGRMLAWSLADSGARRANGRSLSDPSRGRLAAEIAVLFMAAAVPMAVIVSTSPALRQLASLLALKLQLLTSL